MADSVTAGPGTSDRDTVPQDQVNGLLSAIDQAFTDVVHARYGGGIHSVLLRGDRVQEQRLRAAPVSMTAYLLLELHLREHDEAGATASPSGFGRLFQGLSTMIGDVTMAEAPDSGAATIHVITEVFDQQDGAERLAGAILPTGVALEEGSPYLSGPTGPKAIRVVRSAAGQAEGDKLARLHQRGWLAQPKRLRGNRGGGLGNNGHRRATPSNLSCSVAADLLRRLGDRLAKAGEIGGDLEKIVVGLELGDVH